MSTMYDRVLVAARKGKLRTFDGVSVIPAVVEGAVVIRADNIEQWLDAEHEEGDVAFQEQIVCCPPPFERTWIEYPAIGKRCPPEERPLAKQQRWGVLVDSSWTPGEEGSLFGFVFLETPGKEPALVWYLMLLLDGVARPKWEEQILCLKGINDPGFPWPMRVAATVFQFMDSGDSVPRERLSPPVPLSKKWQRKHGVPLVRYWTLDIGPSQAERATAAQIIADAQRDGRASPALHWVRGHFKRGSFVTAEKPQGRYARPHLRGLARDGVVVKDYQVAIEPAIDYLGV